MIDDIKVAKKLLALHSSAKSRDIEFNLTFKKVKQLLTRKTCFYTGTPFDNKYNGRSIDRVDNTKGYIDSNVVACTVRINSLKSDLSIGELNRLTNKVNSFIKN